MKTTITQFRVSFTVENVRYSTKWFDSEDEALNSKWMSEENAVIIKREYRP